MKQWYYTNNTSTTTSTILRTIHSTLFVIYFFHKNFDCTQNTKYFSRLFCISYMIVLRNMIVSWNYHKLYHLINLQLLSCKYILQTKLTQTNVLFFPLFSCDKTYLCIVPRMYVRTCTLVWHRNCFFIVISYVTVSVQQHTSYLSNLKIAIDKKNDSSKGTLTLYVRMYVQWSIFLHKG